MRRSEIENYEDIEIVGFALPQKTDGEVSVDTLRLQVPFGTTPFAKAAMLKGLQEFFLKVSGDEGQISEEQMKQVESNLDVYRRKVSKVKNSIIL